MAIIEVELGINTYLLRCDKVGNAIVILRRNLEITHEANFQDWSQFHFWVLFTSKMSARIFCFSSKALATFIIDHQCVISARSSRVYLLIFSSESLHFPLQSFLRWGGRTGQRPGMKMSNWINQNQRGGWDFEFYLFSMDSFCRKDCSLKLWLRPANPK